MKLSVAATLLAQCVPALPQTLLMQDVGSTVDNVIHPLKAQGATPSTHAFNKLKSVSGHAKQRVLSKVQGTLKNVSPQWLKGHLQCDPSSTDADTGVLSCDHGFYCKESHASNHGGFCRAIPTSQSEAHAITTTYPSVPIDKDARLSCDPNAPDLGILSCGQGEICRPDGTSDMGGICVPTATASRKLVTVDAYLTSCDPSSSDYSPYCDCGGVDTTTGTGAISCLQSDYELCAGVIADIGVTYSFTSRNLTSLRACYEITVPYYQKACIVSNFQDGADVSSSCTIEFNGQECSSCVSTDSFYDFDCSAIDPNLVGSDVPQLLPVAAQCAYGPGGGGNYSVCIPCTEGTIIPPANYATNVTIEGYGDLSCGALAYGSANGLVPDALCPVFAGLAQASCCAPANTDPTSTPAPSSANVPDGGEPAPAPEGEEPAPAPEGEEPAPAPDGGSSAPLLPFHGVVWSVIVSTLAQMFVP